MMPNRRLHLCTVRQERLRCHNMVCAVCSLCLLVYQFLKTYFYGIVCLCFQVTQKHVRPTNIPSQPRKVAIVTGGASGIGLKISWKLAQKQVHVVIAGPEQFENEKAVKEITSCVPGAKVESLLLDLSSFQCVEKFTKEFLSRNLPLHILINNAGVMFTPYQITEDGLERQVQVNYFSHCYLTQRLLPKLQESGKDNSWSRIINISSCMHFNGRMDLSTFGKSCQHWYKFSSHAAYCDSKLAIVLSTYRLNTYLRDRKLPVSANVVHPGIVKSGLTQNLTWLINVLLQVVIALFYKDSEQGADVSVYAALSPDLERHSGHYYDNCTEAMSSPVSYSSDLQEKLWDNTVQIFERKKEI